MKAHKPLAAIGLAALLGLTACAGGGSAAGARPGGADAAGPGNKENIAAAAEVFEKFNKLTGQDRMDELIAAAKEEGKLTVYSTLTPESAPVVEKAFEAAYGIELEMARMSSEDVITKITTEQSAGNAKGADVLELNGFELTALAGQGHFADFEGPERDAVIEAGQREGWTADRLNQFVVSRNIDKMPDGDWPERIEDFADPKYKGNLSIEINEVDWFMALFEYYTQEKGMSEDKVMELFKGIAANSVKVDGHATQIDQLASGILGVAMSTYDYQAAGIAKTGAPVTYEPLIGPIVQRPNGVALMNSAPHPAAAYLFYTWILTDGQEVLQEAGLRSSLQEDAESGTQDVETILVDTDRLVEEYDLYADKYAEVIGR
jgi:iron(III) transport system substrate-binding protein